MRDYSQHGEQETILNWATGIGSFLDLGSYDGETYSNTAALADLGWGGICVDAAPDAAGACALRYAARDDVSVILAAFAVDIAYTVAIDWSPKAMYSNIAYGQHRADTEWAVIEISLLDLAWFADRVSRLPRPLFCSIDLEGGSLEALAWVLQHVGPDCLCVEANNPDEKAEVRRWLGDWTELLSNDSNMIFSL